jgi:hypothetical protein
MSERDLLVGSAVDDLPVPAHAAGFTASLHASLADTAPAVARESARRRTLTAALLAAATLLLAGGVAWGAMRALAPEPAPPAPTPVTTPSLEPTRQPTVEPVVEPTTPPKPAEPAPPTRAEARAALVHAAASRRVPERALEATLAAITRSERAWWVLGWVRVRPDADMDPLDTVEIVLRRADGAEGWDTVVLGTNLTPASSLPKVLRDAPDVLRLVMKELNTRAAFPQITSGADLSQERVRTKAYTTAMGSPATSQLPGSQLEPSDARIAADGRDMWASVLLRAMDGTSKGKSLRVYLVWRDGAHGFGYVSCSTDPDPLREVPARLRDRL